VTTRANNPAIHRAACSCGADLLVFQARGKRAYLYTRCVLCGFNQQPHVHQEQQRLWDLLPAEIQAEIRRPLILTNPAAVCPCCGKAAAA
jgi:hypothetical protein